MKPASAAANANQALSNFRYRCAHCDKLHVGLPDICFPAPSAIQSISEREFERNCLINDDVCIVGGHSYYLNAILEVPVIGHPDRFAWGIWCKTEWSPFKLYWQNDPERQHVRLRPAQATIANDISGLRSTDGLDCELDFRGQDLRPLVRVSECRHPLYRIQQQGISLSSAIEQAQTIGAFVVIS